MMRILPRQSWVSFLFAQGVQPGVVSELLGRSNIAITMNTYAHAAHVLEKARREALEKVSRLLAWWPPGGSKEGKRKTVGE